MPSIGKTILWTFTYKKPMWMLCPDCGKVTIDTNLVKMCKKCNNRYPEKYWKVNGY
jgi:predicted RNA-binding Zn-ribbon protein involved in translation (DUF1610 family)